MFRYNPHQDKSPFGAVREKTEVSFTFRVRQDVGESAVRFIVRKDAETGAKELSFAEAYDEIERNVKQRLGQEAYKAWIQRLRDAAFIKIYPFPEEK